MKKIIKFCLLTSPCFCFSATNAQWSTTTVAPNIRVTNTAAKVGIGDYPDLNTPIDPLTIGGDISLYPTSASADRRINARSISSMLQLSANSNIADGSCIQLYGRSHPTANGMIDFTANTYSGGGGIACRFNVHNGVTGNPLFILYRDGNSELYGHHFTFNPTTDAERTIDAKTTTSLFSINANVSANDGPSIKMYGRSHPTGPGIMDFFASSYTGGVGNIAFRFNAHNGVTGNPLFIVYRNGSSELYGHHFTFNPTTDAERTIDAKTTTSLFSINANISSNDGPSIKMYGRSHPTGPGMMTFAANALSADPNQSAYRFDVYSPSTNTSKAIMVMYKGGNMEVCGKIRAKEIVVETGWCDYVFNDNYKLRSLNELEQYIKAYRHLPEIPTTEEITTNGAPIGEMTSKLLLKVEELTLYMLQLKKQNDALQAEVNVLKSKI
ncbi:MAG: hypothetical protein WC756_11275 [Taibaiella sp.]|jgi:hypothetical protein